MTDRIQSLQLKHKELQHHLQQLLNELDTDNFSTIYKQIEQQQNVENTLVELLLMENKELKDRLKENRRLIAQTIEKHELERRNLWKNTLDSIEQLLYSFLLVARSLHSEPISDSIKTHLQNLTEIINVKLDQLRHEALHLYPTGIEDLGLLGSIKSYYATLRSKGFIQYEVDFVGHIGRHTESIEIHLFRFLQSMLLMLNSEPFLEKLQISVINDAEKITLQLSGDGLIKKLDILPELQWSVEVFKNIQETVIEAPNGNDLLIEIFI